MYGIFMESWVILKNYAGQGWIFILFLLSLGYLFITEKNKKIRSLMIYAPVVTLVAFLCPLFRKVYVRLLGEGVTYYRVLWLLPISVTVAYAACKLIWQIKSRIGKKEALISWVGAAMAAVCIAAAGKYVYGSQYISKAENAYHIPQEVIELCEMIKPREGELEYVYAAFPSDLVYYVRQYDTHICLAYGRDMVEPVWGYVNNIYNFMEKDEMVRAKLLLATTRSQGDRTSRYIVLRKDKPIDTPLEELGLSIVGETQNYKVYEDPVAVQMLKEMFSYLNTEEDDGAVSEENLPDNETTGTNAEDAQAAEDANQTQDDVQSGQISDASDAQEPQEGTEEDTRSQEEIDLENSLKRNRAASSYESEILPEFRPVYEVNNRVVGYIQIEGTDIDCPVLQTIEDYEFYLTHDIVGNESKQGCIILDADSEIGIGTAEKGYLAGYEPSTNQLVHGHNMKSGTMFGSLDAYAKESYAEKHPLIRFDSLYEHRTYEVVLAFYSKVYPEEEDVFKYYNFNQADTKEEFDEWYENIKKLALYRRNVDISYGDEMITLSTCAYQEKDGRFAVVGKRIE